MALLVPDAAEVVWLKAVINHTAPQNLVLKLFKNNHTPAEGDTEADYTEADFSGYAALTLTGSSWSVSSSGGVTTASYAQQTFTSDADQSTQSVYGYYLVQASSGKIMWAEKFTDGPYPISFNGDDIKVTPKVTLE
jgi:hypothetical protein